MAFLRFYARRATIIVMACAAGNWALAADPALDTGTNFSIGPGEYITPSYPGASSSRGFLMPFIDAEYLGRFYTNASDLLGVYAYKTAGDAVGAAIQYDFTERLSHDDARFKNLPDVQSTPRIKLFADKTISLFTLDVNVAKDIANRGQGTLAQANLWMTLPMVPKWLFSFGPGLTWADNEYMTTFFSISPEQAAISPLRPYASRAGIDDLHLNALATYDISSRWSVGASAYIAELHGDAVNSPVTLRREQTTVLAWIAYKIIR